MAQIRMHPAQDRSPKSYALLYAGLGWAVFPVFPITSGAPGQGSVVGICACSRGAECDRPGKHPMSDLVPNGVLDATTDIAKINAWWGARPWASIGIATGFNSGITVIDADVSNGKPGLVNLTRMAADHGGLPSTFTVNTGSGGLHLYFKFSDALSTGSNVLGEGIDVRNNGGYVIAPPSLHVRGQYKWSRDSGELQSLPEWLHRAPEAPRESTRRRGRPRTRAALDLGTVESMLGSVDAEDRDIWLKVGVVLGRAFVGAPEENEAWNLYERWAARSEKFDEDRAENVARMREMFYERSQESPRAGGEQLGIGSLVKWARDGGWSPIGDRAEVKYEPGSEAKMAEELTAALVSNPETARFFNIMGEVRDVLRSVVPSIRLMTVLREGESPPELLIVRRTSSSSIVSELSRCAALMRESARGIPSVHAVPEILCSIILREMSSQFPTLTGVAQWPLVNMRGELLYRRTRGWDKRTGIYFDIDPSVAVDETLGAEEAWEWLREEMLADFPFEDEKSRAAGLAMLLAMMQRPLMKTCPAFAIVAPQAGSGKSTFVEVASLAIHAQPMALHSLSSDEEELRKALHALIIAKIPAVTFDNVSRGKAVDSDNLAKLITSEMSTDRVLGASETRKEPNQTLVIFTGNNIAFVRDMSSRVMMVEMNAKMENPLRRNFRHPDIRAWASQQRSRILSCLVAIAKLADGARPPGAASRFEDFDVVVARPVLKLTGVDVRDSLLTLNADTDEDEETRAVLGMIWRWQEEWRSPEENGKAWRTRELTESLNGNAWPTGERVRLRQWYAGERNHEHIDHARALGTAFRGIKDNHAFSPFVLRAKMVEGDRKWLITNRSTSTNDEVSARDSF